MSTNQSNVVNTTSDKAQKTSIAAFINAISVKKYALAHKYLTGVVNEKIKKRINKAATKPLF